MMNELLMKEEEKLYDLIDTIESSDDEENEYETELPKELSSGLSKVCNHSGSLIDDHVNGYEVCTECGQIFRELFDTSPEWRQFDENGSTGKARCNNKINPFLPKSSLNTVTGGFVNFRLREIQKWNAMPYDERTLYKILKMIEKCCRAGNILKCAEDEAKILYKNISKCRHLEGEKEGKKVISRGRNKKGLIAACVYHACKRIGITRKPKEIAKLFDIRQHDLTKGCKIFTAMMEMIGMEYNIRQSNPEDFIPRFCNELHLKKCYIEMSVTVAKNIKKLNVGSVHTPLSIASGSILLIANLNNLNITKKMIATKFGVSEITVLKSFKKIANYGPILINDDLTDQIVEFIKEENKKITMPAPIEIKYKEFEDRFADNNIYKLRDLADEKIYCKLKNTEAQYKKLVKDLATKVN